LSNDPLQVRYTSQGARDYDVRREGSKRFRDEEAAFAAFFDRVKPGSVIDCPFGTGRWLPFYQNIKGPIIGIDLSEDMLRAARQKIEGGPAIDLTLICASIFDYDFGKLSDDPPDVLVCTRFVNWVSAPKMKAAISNLSASGAKWAVIGASVRPSGSSFLPRMLMKLRLTWQNWRAARHGAAIQHVHDERCLDSAFDANGWQIVDKVRIFSNPTRKNYFWLLERKAPLKGLLRR
jgi:SAM-dependent methyltransferase